MNALSGRTKQGYGKKGENSIVKVRTVSRLVRVARISLRNTHRWHIETEQGHCLETLWELCR
jgi:hypothetical protein